MKSEVNLGMKSSGQSSSGDKIIRVLRQFNSAITVSNRSVMADLQLKDNDLAVLNALDQKGTLSPGELANITHTHLATMTGVLTRLENHGWIVRENNSTDRRSITVRAVGVERLSHWFEGIDQKILKTFQTYEANKQTAIIHFLQEISGLIEHDSTKKEK